jgi:predicted regulator of Ras-like GTPase activity (Roadblock/LC7/MglB family)
MELRRQEAPRDQAESAFTPILRRLWEQLPALLAAAFVDVEGECIDYVSRVEPYEAKVNAAHLHMLLGSLVHSWSKLGQGEAFGLEIDGSAREACVRRVAADYMLVVVLAAGTEPTQRDNAIALACAEFRQEVGLAPPPWEAAFRRLSVRVRPATGWNYAPQGYSDGVLRVTITDVIGRWTEPGGSRGEDLVCFRVRTGEGQELTLVHDPDGAGWVARE